MVVDAQVASLLLHGGVFGPQGIEIVGHDGCGRWRRRRLGVAALFPLVTPAEAHVSARRGVKLDFVQGGEGIVLNNYPIAPQRRIDSEEQALHTHVREVLVDECGTR